jgi:thiol:disulfide interchange protein DsbG
MSRHAPSCHLARLPRQGLICCLAGFLGIWGVASAQTLPAAFRLHGPALQQRLQAVWTESWQRPGILTGSAQAKRRIVVFFDPNCPYCAHLWRDLQAWKQRLQVRWIPIAFLRHSSLGLAAAILSAPSPRHALAINEGTYVFQTRTGGYLPLSHPAPHWRQVIHLNTQLWAKNFRMTPTLLYHGVHKWHDVVGLPNRHQLQTWFGPPDRR